jgi:hypothetical protein
MRVATLVLAVVLAAVEPAHAAWKEYTYADLGIAKYFPVEPKVEKGSYGEGIRLPLSKIVPATIVSAEDGGVTYKMTIVDFTGREADGANLMAEAVSWLGSKGDIVSQGFPRLDLGNASVYGLMLIVDEKGGDRAASAVFFNKGRLYIVQAVVPKDSPARNNPGIGRFIETVRFHLQGYGFDAKIGHDFPIGDDDPYDRDLGRNRPAPPAQAPN